MSLAQRISWNEQHRVAEQARHSSQASARRTTAVVDDELAFMTEKNIELTRENRELAEENARALTLIRAMADRSEAFRRVTAHLRQHWAPSDASELGLKESVKPMVEKKAAEVAQDGEWKTQTEARLERDFPKAKARERKAQKTKR